MKDPIEMQQFKGLHNLKRVFMIGNGPSLKDVPMERLIGRHTFAMNNISDYWTTTGSEWRPQYYFNYTTQVIRYRSWLDKANLAVDECHIAFIRKNSPIKDARNVCRFDGVRRQCDGCGIARPFFSTECDKRVGYYVMSMWGMAQIAAYMGFKEFILLGFDLGFQASGKKGEDPNHFAPGYAGGFRFSNYTARRDNFYHYEAHRHLQKALNRLGINVYNATPGSELELYPRLDLGKVL